MSLIPDLWNIILEYLWVEVTTFRILKTRQLDLSKADFYTSDESEGIIIDLNERTTQIGHWSFDEVTPFLDFSGLDIGSDYNLDKLNRNLVLIRCSVCFSEINPESKLYYVSNMPVELTANPSKELRCEACIDPKSISEYKLHKGRLYTKDSIFEYKLRSKTFIAVLTAPRHSYVFYWETSGKIKMLEIKIIPYDGIVHFVGKQTMTYPDFIKKVATLIFKK